MVLGGVFMGSMYASWLAAPITWVLFMIVFPIVRKRRGKSGDLAIPWVEMFIFAAGVAVEIATRAWVAFPVAWMLICAIDFIHDIHVRPVTTDTIFNSLYHSFSVVLIGVGLATGFWLVSWTAFPIAMAICWVLSKTPRFRKVKLELRRLTPLADSKVYEMLQAIPADENGFMNDAHGMSFPEHLEWLMKMHENSQGIGLEDWQVPQTIFWLYADGKPVGMAKLRHRLTEKLQFDGGHAGYAIAPHARGKGYGTRIVKFLTAEAREIGIERILLTINVDNEPSVRAALSADGVIEKTTTQRHYIWID
jgi:predicted acetyltransferase